MMRSRLGFALTVTGFLACPCHLPLTLPLLLTLLGGTSLGLFLRANTGVILVAASAYFLIAIGSGLVLLTHRANLGDRQLGCPIDQSSSKAKDPSNAGLDSGANTPLRS